MGGPASCGASSNAGTEHGCSNEWRSEECATLNKPYRRILVGGPQPARSLTS